MSFEAKDHCLPVIIGISGHRIINEDDRPRVAALLEKHLDTLKAMFDGNVYLATGLAEGADQMAAEIATKIGIPRIALLAMETARFRDTISTDLYHPARVNFDALLSNCTLQIELPTLDTLEHPSDEIHYEQLGVALSRFSHILIALYDGVDYEPPAFGDPDTGRGGTAHVVYLRTHGEQNAEAFRVSPIFKNAHSCFDLASGGPWIHIPTPKPNSKRPMKHEGHTPLFALSANSDHGGTKKNPFGKIIKVKPAQLRQYSLSETKHWVTQILANRKPATPPFPAVFEFLQIIRMNRRITNFSKIYQNVLDGQMKFPDLTEIPETAPATHEKIQFLARRMAAIDTAAQYYQRRLLGEAKPTDHWRDRIKKFAKALFRDGHVSNPGAVLIYAFSFLAGLAAFEYYGDLDPAQPILVTLYAVILSVGFAFHLGVVKRQHWQNHFQDYRAVAEAMRVQIFWAMAGMPDAVADHYMRQQKDELGWIAFAMRGPALWALAIAEGCKNRPLRDTIATKWIKDQRDYFLGEGEKFGAYHHNRSAHARTQNHHYRLLILAGVTTGLLTIGAWVIALFPDISLIQTLQPELSQIRGWGLFVTVMLLALSTASLFIADKFSFEAHSHNYSAMGNLFTHAQTLAGQEPYSSDTKDYRTMLLELGREALAENADWLQDHRRRTVETI